MGIPRAYASDIPLAPRNTWYAHPARCTVLLHAITHLTLMVLAYYAIRDQDEKGKKMLHRVYGNVPGYDLSLIHI